MRVKFWGTRGSIPVAMTALDVRAKVRKALLGASSAGAVTPESIDAYLDSLNFDVVGTYGGHSSCVQIETGRAEHIILDSGTGIRPLGQSILTKFGPDQPQTYHLFMSHLHWDHIMGFPFFAPVYIPGNRIIVHSCHVEVEHAFRRQQGAPSFPLAFEQFAATIAFDVLTPDTAYEIAGLKVSAHRQRHGGDSYAWRFEDRGRSVVYATDAEHRLDDKIEREGMVAFYGGADAVIFDAMYSLADSISVKADWGHSSNIVGVELCQAARAKRMVMFHHEPAYNDTQIQTLLHETRRFEEITRDGPALEILSAWDGFELEL
jgi:phosphoribosyl 1,2-cyclic phosphodiesterase